MPRVALSLSFHLWDSRRLQRVLYRDHRSALLSASADWTRPSAHVDQVGLFHCYAWLSSPFSNRLRSPDPCTFLFFGTLWVAAEWTGSKRTQPKTTLCSFLWDRLVTHQQYNCWIWCKGGWRSLRSEDGNSSFQWWLPGTPNSVRNRTHYALINLSCGGFSWEYDCWYLCFPKGRIHKACEFCC